MMATGDLNVPSAVTLELDGPANARAVDELSASLDMPVERREKTALSAVERLAEAMRASSTTHQNDPPARPTSMTRPCHVATASPPAVPSPSKPVVPAIRPSTAILPHPVITTSTTHQNDPPERPTSMTQSTAEYVVLHQRDERALERQAEYRTRCKHPDEMCGTGNREGSWHALERACGVLVVCGKHGCCALGAYVWAVRAAHAAGRVRVRSGDGCGAKGCGVARWHKAARYAATQRRWAAALRAGTMQLATRPETTEQEQAVRVVGEELEGAIEAALRQTRPAKKHRARTRGARGSALRGVRACRYR
jgi:hypothetical protein